MSIAGTHLPFPALVGLDVAQQALLLLAVDPELRGLVIAAPVGSKSSARRASSTLCEGGSSSSAACPRNDISATRSRWI